MITSVMFVITSVIFASVMCLCKIKYDVKVSSEAVSSRCELKLKVKSHWANCDYIFIYKCNMTAHK